MESKRKPSDSQRNPRASGRNAGIRTRGLLDPKIRLKSQGALSTPFGAVCSRNGCFSNLSPPMPPSASPTVWVTIWVLACVQPFSSFFHYTFRTTSTKNSVSLLENRADPLYFSATTAMDASPIPRPSCLVEQYPFSPLRTWPSKLFVDTIYRLFSCRSSVVRLNLRSPDRSVWQPLIPFSSRFPNRLARSSSDTVIGSGSSIFQSVLIWGGSRHLLVISEQGVQRGVGAVADGNPFRQTALIFGLLTK